MNRARKIKVIIPVACISLGLISNASSYQLGLTYRNLKVSNNGEYFEKETDIGFKPGLYFQPNYLLSPYVEILYLNEAYEVLPIVGIRLRPKLEKWWVKPRVGLNVFPRSFQMELETSFKLFHLGAYFEILNWGDQGWLSQGIKIGYNIPIPIK